MPPTHTSWYIVSSHCLIEKLPVCFVDWLVAFCLAGSGQHWYLCSDLNLSSVLGKILGLCFISIHKACLYHSNHVFTPLPEANSHATWGQWHCSLSKESAPLVCFLWFSIVSQHHQRLFKSNQWRFKCLHFNLFYGISIDSVFKVHSLTSFHLLMCFFRDSFFYNSEKLEGDTALYDCPELYCTV